MLPQLMTAQIRVKDLDMKEIFPEVDTEAA
jgi:hypothetical protein